MESSLSLPQSSSSLLRALPLLHTWSLQTRQQIYASQIGECKRDPGILLMSIEWMAENIAQVPKLQNLHSSISISMQVFPSYSQILIVQICRPSSIGMLSRSLLSSSQIIQRRNMWNSYANYTNDSLKMKWRCGIKSWIIGRKHIYKSILHPRNIASMRSQEVSDMSMLHSHCGGTLYHG